MIKTIKILFSYPKGNLMKKTFLFTLLIFALTLTACSGTASASQASSTQESAALPTATELIVGTLKLEGTDQAVTADQAKELLMLWQVYQELSNNDTAAQAEFDGLIDQIQGTMTAAQIQAITAMKLTQSDVFALMQEKGISVGQPQQSSNSSTQSSGGFAPPAGGMAGGPPDAGMAGGAPPDSGIAGMGSIGSTTSTGQTQGTGAGAGIRNSAGASSALVDALIQVLEQKAGS
jgi:hypothetical protein